MDNKDFSETPLSDILEDMKKPDPEREKAYEAWIALLSKKYNLPVEVVKIEIKAELKRRFAERFDPNNPIGDGAPLFSTNNMTEKE